MQKSFIVDVRLGSKCWPTDRFPFDTNFYRKIFFQAGYWNLNFNSKNSTIIPNITKKIWNMNKIYMTKFVSLKKSAQKWSSWKEILSWMIWDFSVIQQKHALTCPGLYRLIFQSLYNTSLISPKREIDETVNFRNFRKLFTNKFAAFFVVFWHPISKREKRNDVTGHMKHAAMAVTCTLHWGSWCSYKEVVIIKMNEMFYF